MSLQRLLTLGVMCGIFASVIFVNTSVGSYSILHLVVFLNVFLTVLYYDRAIAQRTLRIDKISGALCIFALVVALSYLVNLQYYGKVAETYRQTSGNSPSFLYGKISINGLIALLIAFFAYRFGKVLITSEESVLRLIFWVSLIISTNGIVNVVAWLIEAHGVIGRYNFEPPITGSPGVSIQLSSLGFMLILPLLKFYRRGNRRVLLLIMASVLMLNVLIIITRQSQVMFFIMLLTYYLFDTRLTLKTGLFLMAGGCCLIVLFVGVLVITGNAGLYLDINSADAVDVAIRFATIESAWNMFIENLWFGVGYGMFSGHNLTAIYITGVEFYLASPHNGLFAIISELGIIGLLSYCFLVMTIVWVLNANRKSIKRTWLKSLATSIYAVQLVMIASFFIGNSHLIGPPSEIGYLCYSYLSWLFIGLSLAISKIDKKVI